MSPEVRAKIDQLNAERLALAGTLTKALTDAGFVLSRITTQGEATRLAPFVVPTEMTDRGRVFILVSHPSVKGWEEDVQIEPQYACYSARIANNVLNIGKRGYGSRVRSRVRRYTKLDDSVVSKVLAYYKEALEFAQRSAVASQQAQTQQQATDAKRRVELAGLVVPPGMEAKPWVGTPDDKPLVYSVRFEQHTGLLAAKLTAEQVRRLAAAVTEIVGTSFWVVTKQGPQGAPLYQDYDSSEPFFVDDLKNTRLFTSEAEAQVMREKATAKGHTEVRVVSYADAYLSA